MDDSRGILEMNHQILKRMPAANKNYMSIAVSVLTTSRVARNSGGAARQENRPQSATAYSSVRYA